MKKILVILLLTFMLGGCAISIDYTIIVMVGIAIVYLAYRIITQGWAE